MTTQTSRTENEPAELAEMSLIELHDYCGEGCTEDAYEVMLARAERLERELEAANKRADYAIEMRDGYRKAGNELLAERAATIADLIAALEAVALTSSPIRGDIYSTDTDALLAVSEIARATLAKVQS